MKTAPVTLHHKSHTDSLGTEPAPPNLEAGCSQHKVWYGHVLIYSYDDDDDDDDDDVIIMHHHHHNQECPSPQYGRDWSQRYYDSCMQRFPDICSVDWKNAIAV